VDPALAPKPKSKVTKARALYDYRATRPDELSFSKGDVIILISADGEWWQGKKDNKVGLFPSSHVRIIKKKAGAKKQSVAKPQPLVGFGSPKAGPKKAGKTQAKAKFDYAAQNSNELSFAQGVVMTITKKDPVSGWWTATFNGQTGLVPSNYLEVIKKKAGAAKKKNAAGPKQPFSIPPPLYIPPSVNIPPPIATPPEPEEPTNPLLLQLQNKKAGLKTAPPTPQKFGRLTFNPQQGGALAQALSDAMKARRGNEDETSDGQSGEDDWGDL